MWTAVKLEAKDKLGAAWKDHLPVADDLTKRHANLEVKGPSGRAPLVGAAYEAQLQVVKYFRSLRACE